MAPENAADDEEVPSIGPGRMFPGKPSEGAPAFAPGPLDPATPPPPPPGALMGDGDTQMSSAPLSLYGENERTPAAAIVAIVLGFLLLGGLAFLFRGVFLG